MIELTKISTDKVHQLFKMLKKLGLYDDRDIVDNVDEIYNAWKYAEKYELQKK